MSGTITSTDESGVQPRVQRLRYRAMIQRPGATQYIVKIYSKAKITDSNLETSFGRGKIGWAHRQAWDAYRYFPPGSNFPPVKTDPRMYLLV
ncbi:hypothetical protein FRC06_011634 [Ceratobasidium sp. 370]|nr:hypothetical protein FRC06_011634 [Ceratobasidium sp. 370]